MTDPAQDRIASLEQRLAKNPSSPLFARLADCYLQAGRANDALRLCDDGLAHFPFYATAHLVKADALMQLGMKAEARHAYEVVHELMPTNQSVSALLATAEPEGLQEAQTITVEEEHAEPARFEEPVAEHVQEEAVAEHHPEAVEQPEAPAPDDQALVVEEPVAPIEEIIAASPAPFEEPPALQAEELPPEPAAEEPQQPAEESLQQPEQDAFGFGEQPAPPQPEEPSAADKLGLFAEPEPQQEYANFDFGAPPEQPVAPAADLNAFGGPEVEEVHAPAIAPEPEAPAQEPPALELPSLETEAAPAPAGEPAPPSSEDQSSEWFEAFSQLQQPAETASGAAPETPTAAEEENPFAVFGTEASPTAVEGEPYDDFAARVRMEQFGTEDTLSLEEYLGQTSVGEPPASPDNNIGEIAEKLKSTPRITPPVINFSEKASRSSAEAEAGGGSGFVTPTLAEIYVKQGWFDDAIKAYRALAANKPAEKEKFEQRIAEIEEMKKK